MDILTANQLSEDAKRALVARENAVARDLVDRILIHHPEHGHALQVRATLALRSESFEEALDASSRALRSMPSDPGVMNIAASAMRLLHRFEEAEILLREALRVAPHLAETHLNLALTLMDIGSHAKAETYFRNVISLRKDSERAFYYLGRIASENSRFAEAVTLLRSALAISPTNLDARGLLIEALLGGGLTEEALAEVDIELRAGRPDSRILALAVRINFELARGEPALFQFIEKSKTGFSLHESTRVLVLQSAKLGLIDLWCTRNEARYFRLARAQWLNFGKPAVYPPEDAGAFVVPRPFSRELFIASIPEARILPRDLMLLTSDNELLVEGIFSNAQSRIYKSRFIRTVADDGRVLLEIPKRNLKLQGAVCYLGSADSFFNWVYECVGRMWIIHQRPELAALPLLVSDQITERQCELLTLMGIAEGRIVKVPRDAVVTCTMVHVPANPVVGWFVAPMAVEFLRRSLGRQVASTKSERRRLFFGSSSGDFGKISNEAEIWSQLERRGFERIVPSEMSTEDLCSWIAGAEVVVGPANDAMAYLFLLPAGAAVCVFCPRGTASPKLFCASATLGVKFNYIVCEPDFSTHQHIDSCDMHVRSSLLLNCLSDLNL